MQNERKPEHRLRDQLNVVEIVVYQKDSCWYILHLLRDIFDHVPVFLYVLVLELNQGICFYYGFLGAIISIYPPFVHPDCVFYHQNVPFEPDSDSIRQSAL